MRITRSIRYAIEATVLLADRFPKAPLSCNELAKEGGMPPRFLLQILRSLVVKGVLTSTRGVDGGYILARHPSEISLLEVMEAIDGSWGVEYADADEEFASPMLMETLQVVSQKTREYLGGVKMSDFTQLHNPPSQAPSLIRTLHSRPSSLIAPNDVVK